MFTAHQGLPTILLKMAPTPKHILAMHHIIFEVEGDAEDSSEEEETTTGEMVGEGVEEASIISTQKHATIVVNQDIS